MTATQRVAQGLMVVLGLLAIVFNSSVYADTTAQAFPRDANGLIASSGVGLGLLVVILATAGLHSGERWAWLSLWVLPAYLLSHCVLIGTWLPDAVLASLSVVALVVTRPRYDVAPA